MVKLVVALSCLLAPCLVWSQDGPLRPTRIDDVVRVDGILNEDVWQQAAVWDELVQGFPIIGGRPSERTEIRMLYNDDFLYVGITAFDSVPARIIATGLERDVYYGSDDHLSITLDTYNDKRQGLLFSTNPLSARFDEEVLDNGNTFNAAYNTFWDVKVRRDAGGYSAEFRIPFSSLRFRPAEEVVMGFKVVRCIKHRNEFDIFPASDATLANAVWRVNNSREIVFTNLRPRKPFYLFPYVKGDYQRLRSWDPVRNVSAMAAETMRRNNYVDKSLPDRLLSNTGIDLKLGLSKNFTLDATINTDFAQAETDNRVLNFTRFAVNLPEKRNFFLESKDYLGFSTASGMLLFNSRTIGIEKGTIVPLVGGVRVSGKARGLQVGILDMQTHGHAAMTIDPQHFSIVRMRQEMWGNGSYVGGMMTNRVSTHGRTFNNQVAALDVVRRFNDNKWLLSSGAAVSFDNNVEEIDGKSGMINAAVARVTSVGFNHASSIEYTGSNFKAKSGFAPDSAYLTLATSNGHIWKWKGSDHLNLWWLTHAVNYKYRTINKTHESFYTELESGLSFLNGASLVSVPLWGREFVPYQWTFRNDIVIPTGYYSYAGVRLRFDGRQTRQLNYSVVAQFQGFYGGMRVNALLNGYYALSSRFRFTWRYDWNAFSFPGAYSTSGRTDVAYSLLSAGVSFTQSIYFSVRALLQYDDASKTVGGNFRLRFNPKEGTDLYVVYNPRLNMQFPSADGSTHPVADQQVVIVKFSRAISL